MEIVSLIKIFEALVEYLKITAPIPTLREAIEQKRWFYGIVMATAFFEVFGLELLKEKFKGKISGDKLEHLRLEQIILFLHSSEIIDQPTYTKMMEVKEVRNNITHNPFEVELKDDEAKNLIEKAIDCLKALGLPDEEEPEIVEEIVKLPSLKDYEKKDKES